MRLGHDISVALKSYVGRVRNVSAEARTLEAAMEIEEQAERIVGRLREGIEAKPRRAAKAAS